MEVCAADTGYHSCHFHQQFWYIHGSQIHTLFPYFVWQYWQLEWMQSGKTEESGEARLFQLGGGGGGGGAKRGSEATERGSVWGPS